jgi:hypothetical protein
MLGRVAGYKLVMMNTIKYLTAAVAATALVALAEIITMPVAAWAQTSTTQTTYTTALMQVEPVPAPGEFDGRLKLTVTSDGLVSGYYFPSDSGTIVSVVGGEQNGRYWMDIGGNTQLHIYAELGKDGSLVGTATPTPPERGLKFENYAETYSFVAKLQPAR